MAADENGFDPELNYTKEDNEFWDGTEAAHPAWWRGADHATKQITKQLQKIILGPESTEELTYQEVRQHLKLAMKAANELIIESALIELSNLWADEYAGNHYMDAAFAGMNEIANLPKPKDYPDDKTVVTATGLVVAVSYELDGRIIAEVPGLPGCLVYGDTENEAVEAAEKLARQIDEDNKTLTEGES